jgi:ASC-1-like (ASCH) protein
MFHKMKLYADYFELVKLNKKKYEIRLNDDKRKNILVGDIIKFSNFSLPKETIFVKVKRIQYYSSFANLFNHVPLKLIGFPEKSIDEVFKKIYSIYSKEDERKFGVILMEIETIQSTKYII